MNKPVLFLLLLIFIISRPSFGQVQHEPVRIGIICDTINQEIQMPGIVLNEIDALLGLRYDIQCKPENIVQAGFDRDKLKLYFSEFLSNDSIDIIIGIGFVISDIQAKNGPYEKPVIALGVVHPGIQNISLTSENTSGIHNMTYLMMPFSIQRDLQTFYTIYPHKHLGVLIPAKLVDGFDAFAEYIANEMKKYEVEVHTIILEEDYLASLEKIPAEIDAIYVSTLWEYRSDDLVKIANSLIEKKLPSFALFGRGYVEAGFMAGAAPGGNIVNISRRIALDIEKILQDQDPADFTVSVRYQDELVFNMRTAKKIDFYPSFTTLAKAKILFEEDIEEAELITLPQVIATLIENNLGLVISNQDIEAGAKEVNKAVSSWLPQLDIFADGIMIDEARAEASNGLNPERMLLGSAQYSQLLFSEQTMANIKVQKIIQESRKYKYTQDELDILLYGFEAFINVLKAQTYEKIARENLNLTQKHLDIARLRAEIGISGLADVYRWQSELEQANIGVVQSKATRRSAEITLNEILNWPLDKRYFAQDLEENDPFIIDTSFEKLIYDTKVMDDYIAFLVQRAINESPELKQINLTIKANERSLKSVKNSRYVPTIGVLANGSYIFDSGGAGSTPVEPIEIPGLDPIIFNEGINDYQWDIGVRASVPIFQGGYRNAEIQQSNIYLLQLENYKADLENKITQRVLTSLESILASHPTIEMSKRAAEAANKSLEMSQDAYSRGLISIVDLIDVQNAATQSNLYAANAVYDYLLDFLYVSRAVGGYRFMATDEEMSEYQRQFLLFQSQR